LQIIINKFYYILNPIKIVENYAIAADSKKNIPRNKKSGRFISERPGEWRRNNNMKKRFAEILQ